jgi:Heterokaryon incompatibility protein (HET)
VEFQESEAVFHLYTTVEKFEMSCRRGCHLCTIFWNTLEDPQYAPIWKSWKADENFIKHFQSSKRWPQSPVNMRLTPHDSTVSPPLELRILLDDGKERLEFNVAMFISPNNCDDGDPIHASEQYFFSNASDESLSRARSWIEECLRTHQQCNEFSAGVHRLPTRLIDIDSQVQKATPRLVHSSMLENVEYLTLSHRWGPGGAAMMKLTVDNEDELLSGFPMESLPRSFQDAIYVTHRLGYRYLWIDALCIIQGSDDDWIRESAVMGDIFRGSKLTIAAVSAPDSGSGLFTKTNPLAMAACSISTGTEKSIFAIGTKSNSKETPLFERAWVVQERILCARTVEFTMQGLRFNCLSCHREEISIKEGKQDSDDVYPNEEESLRAQWHDLLFQDRSLDSLSTDSVFVAWSRIVQVYTEAKLTNERDRVVAFDGIIDVLQKRTRLTFVAGMCKEFMPRGLLWWTYKPITEPSASFQPSWSCTRKKGRIHFSEDIQNLIAECLEFRSTPPSVVCKGKLQAPRVHQTGGDWDQFEWMLVLQDAQSNRRRIYRSAGLRGMANTLCVVDTPETFSFRVEFCSDIVGVGFDDVSLLYFAQDKDYVEGLALQPYQGNKTAMKRVGYFRLLAFDIEASEAYKYSELRTVTLF